MSAVGRPASDVAFSDAVKAVQTLENDEVCLFLVDYAHRQRVKIWGAPASSRTMQPSSNG